MRDGEFSKLIGFFSKPFFEGPKVNQGFHGGAVTLGSLKLTLDVGDLGIASN